MFDWIADFFAELFNLIPKVIYFLYSSFISLIDLLQLLFRKLAGLDVYYVDGHPVTGDIVTNFIQGILGINTGTVEDAAVNYSPLATVFWSFVIFGVIVCFVATLVAIVKSHYSYNEKSAKGPLPIVATAGKALVNIFIVPIIIVFGLWLSQAILTALDDITTTGNDEITSMYGDRVDLLEPVTRDDGSETYIYYDMFGYTGNILYGPISDALGDGLEGVLDHIDQVFNLGLPQEIDIAKIGANSQPFSGTIFKVAGYNANRVRNGEYVSGGVPVTITGYQDSMGLFNNAQGDQEMLADMIDTAFANFLHLKQGYPVLYEQMYGDLGDVEWGDGSDVAAIISTDRYFTQFLTTSVSAFSKFNVGLVWYYYNLWSFNFIVGFGAAIVAITLFMNLIFGLMVRFFLCIILFLVMPPLAGLAPLDDGKAFGQWRTTFIKQVIIAYAAVVGMNLVLILLPYVNNFDFFDIVIADLVVQTFFIIVGLVAIKNVINVLSQVIGSDDLRAQGDSVAGDVKSAVGKATKMTMGAAKVGGKFVSNFTGAGIAAQLGAVGAKKLGTKIGQTRAGRWLGRGAEYTGAFLKSGIGGVSSSMRANKAKDVMRGAEQQKFIESLDGEKLSKGELKERALAAGFSNAEATQLSRAFQSFLPKGKKEAIVDSDVLKKQYQFKRDRDGLYAVGKKGIKENKSDFTKFVNKGISYDTAEKQYQNAREIQRYRMAKSGVVGGILGGMGSAFTGVGRQMMGNYKTFANTGFKEFMDESGLNKKPDWAEESAKNTKEANKHMENLARQEEETQQLLRQLYNEFRRNNP